MSSSILDLCNEFQLHIKEHCDESRKQFFYDPRNTHYIMRGDKLLVSLGVGEIERWVINKSIQAKSIKQLLKSEGVNIENFDECERSLSETVSPKKNIEIYRQMIK
ncbi:MAG: hypothetical protein K0U08_03285 [Proteobacteria bacterium]|nr:hypothetical protein [Pseudomonadota bacterium]